MDTNRSRKPVAEGIHQNELIDHSFRIALIWRSLCRFALPMYASSVAGMGREMPLPMYASSVAGLVECPNMFLVAESGMEEGVWTVCPVRRAML